MSTNQTPGQNHPEQNPYERNTNERTAGHAPVEDVWYKYASSPGVQFKVTGERTMGDAHKIDYYEIEYRSGTTGHIPFSTFHNQHLKEAIVPTE